MLITSRALAFRVASTIDPEMLEAKFYELSRAFHPDFYQNKSETEQAISLSNAATLNTAYRTLRDPIQRAEYLLDLEAGAVKEIRTFARRQTCLKRFSNSRIRSRSIGPPISRQTRGSSFGRNYKPNKLHSNGASERWKSSSNASFASGTHFKTKARPRARRGPIGSVC